MTWIELAPVMSAELVPQHVAAGLGLREEGGRAAFDALLASLRDRALLLVLDNCEHLVDVCAQLADTLLRAAPGVRILATSREPLGVAGERAWLIPALSLNGDPAAGGDAVGGDAVGSDAVDSNAMDSGAMDSGAMDSGAMDKAAAASEAVQLFIERARDTLPGFTLTAANSAAIVQVRRRLEGMPLAIELAASRVRVLPPEQLAAKLDDAFHALGGGHRTALPRHRTLRAVMDWNYALLSEPERVLLQRRSVFDGGFDLEAAEAACAGGDIAAGAVLDLVAALVDRSLVVMHESAGRARYRLLETVRQYAAERLRAAGEEQEQRGRHAAYFVAFVAAAEPHLITVGRRAWMDVLRRDADNIRQTLGWTREHAPAEHLRLAGMLCWFWFSTRDWLEGRRWLDGALALPEAATPTRERAAARFAAGALATLQAQVAEAAPWLEESAEIAARLGDHQLELSTLAVSRGQLDRAHELTSEGVRIARLFGINRELGIALQMHAGVVLARGDLAQAAVTARNRWTRCAPIRRTSSWHAESSCWA